ncbi:MAG: stage III sporulation protein AB [Clostridiales bacterium]|nr:stage III sporulation protein AB [Clostridiales bacterium]
MPAEGMVLLLRFWGSALMIVGCGGCGLWLSSRYRKRLDELEQLRQMIFLLKGQIIYANATLQEAFGAVGGRTEGPFGELFTRTSERLAEQPAAGFSEIWREEVQRTDADGPLKEADRQALASLGEHLGFLDREMQERNLLLYLEQLDLTLEQLRLHRQERCRLYSSLGVLSGLFLAILLA